MSYHAYQPPYQAPAPYYPPPAAPSDPFRAYYADRLRELTFNSRPIIQELSVMAMQQRDQGSWAGMRAVVEEIENAVARAHPQCKLPLLYLVDSISKNVGQPYTTELLPPIIPRLYIRAYREVDGVIRSKMDEMIALWRTSGPNGLDLYGPSVREGIERELYGSVRALPSYPMQRPVIPPPAPYLTPESVTAVLNTTLDAKNRDCIARPYDGAAREQLGVLLRIRDLLGSGRLTQDELQAIMKQLRDVGTAPPPAPTPQPMAFSPQPHYSTATPAVSPPAPKLPPFPPSLPHDPYRAPPIPSMPPPSTNSQYQAPTSLPIQSGTPVHSSTPLPAPTAVAPLIPANVADILRNLNTSGLLSAPKTPDVPSPKPEVKTALDEYEDRILNLGLKLTSLDLNTTHTLPLSHIPHRCLQCGMRFSSAGAKMQDHMDWHFRRNRKERETEGRGAHRRWLPRASEWINDFSASEAGPSTQNNGPSDPKQPTKLTAEKIAAYRKRWVRVPTDPIKAAQPCPVCKEAFKGEWSEAEEEWVWKNAMEIANKIYHATCRAEQMSSRAASRLLGEARARTSKSPTIRSTPPGGTPGPDGVGVGMGRVESGLGKRKAEEGGEGEKRVKVDIAGGGGEESKESEGVEYANAKNSTEQGIVVESVEPSLPEGEMNGVMPGQVVAEEQQHQARQGVEAFTSSDAVEASIGEVGLGEPSLAAVEQDQIAEKVEQEDDEEPELDV